jgi:hypothetical protein
MLDKKLAHSLKPLVDNRQLWEALKEYLLYLKNSELQALVAATSEQEMFRCQGKVSLLVRLEQLKEQVFEATNRIEEE